MNSNNGSAKYELINTENDCRVRIVRLEDEPVRKDDSDNTLSKFLAMMDRPKPKLPDLIELDADAAGGDDKPEGKSNNLSENDTPGTHGNSSRKRKYGTCQTCGIRMLHRSLKRHMVDKHGDKCEEYPSDQCDYTTSRQHEVSKHKKIHEDDSVKSSKASSDVESQVKNSQVGQEKNMADSEEHSHIENDHVDMNATQDVQSEMPVLQAYVTATDDVNGRFSDEREEASGLSPASENCQSVDELCSTPNMREASKETIEENDVDETDNVTMGTQVDEETGKMKAAGKETDNTRANRYTNQPLSHGLDCLAPPQGYEWFTSMDVSNLTGTDLSQFVLEHRKELERQEHFYQTLGEYRKRAMAVQKEAQDALINAEDPPDSTSGLHQALNDLRRKHRATLSELGTMREDRRKILTDYQAYKRSTQAQINGLTLQIQGIQQLQEIHEADTDGVMEI